MTRIPAPALLLGIAGLLPFVFAALAKLGLVSATLADPLITAQDGRLVMARYGVIILCFMSGVLWGYATRATGTQAAAAYALSTVPALGDFLNPGGRADEVLINLGIGFAGVLALDYAFHKWGLTPPWWMALRVPLTAVVLICLAIGVWA